MLAKLFLWLLGEKLASSFAGIILGSAIGGIAIVAAGNMDKQSIIIGAAGGALSALTGAGGRAKE